MNTVEVLSKQIDYQQWRGSTADELGYGDGSHSPSFIYRHEADNGQQTNVFVADGRRTDDDPTYVGVTPYNYRIDSLLETQSKIKAHQAAARFIITEKAGVTSDSGDPWNTRGDRITMRQIAANLSGHANQAALAQLAAIDAAVHFRPGEVIRLQAESLGTVAIAAMMQVIGEDRLRTSLGVSDVDIIESVNTFGDGQFLRPLQVLKKLDTVEAPLHEYYFDENRIIGHKAVTAFERQSGEHLAIWEYLTKKQRLAVMSPAIGLHRSLHGALAAGIQGKADVRDARITFYRGAHSTVSLENDVVAEAKALLELGGNARVVNLVAGPDDETNIGHHFATSLGRLATFAQQLER